MANTPVVIKLATDVQMRRADKNQVENLQRARAKVYHIPWGMYVGYNYIENNLRHIPCENMYPGFETRYSYRSRLPHSSDNGLDCMGEFLDLQAKTLHQGEYGRGLDTQVLDLPGVKESKQFPSVFKL